MLQNSLRLKKPDINHKKYDCYKVQFRFFLYHTKPTNLKNIEQVFAGSIEEIIKWDYLIF